MGRLQWLLISALIGCWISHSEAALAAMSIDLGSQFIKIGLVKPGVPMEIVLNKESRRKSPNIVSIKNNERLFAEAAAALAVKHPKSAYQFLLDLLGKGEGSNAVETYKQRFPFASIAFDESRGTVSFPSDSETYNVETLLAMILWNCKQDTQAFAGQTVKDVVITVPVFFNQAERKALVAAAKIAGLNLLQLINDGSAAALNYGVFRRKEISDQAQTMLIYDMGASKTTATLVEYLLEEDKQKKEKNPVVRTIGVGFDRSLGGLEMTKRLQKKIEETFRQTVKTETDVATSPRAMAKLFKEAERVKQVLSANTDHFAQIESLHEDHDFKAKVSREEFEQLIADLAPRMIQPVKDALAMADLTIEKVDQVVLMGAATRVPRVQAVLQEILNGKELGRFLNTDEAFALGAVYQAAHLSKSFRVLPFGVQEIQLYPIQVNFKSRNETTGVERAVSRVIFSAQSHYPAPKKTVSMTSYSEDFTIGLSYGDLSILTAEQLRDFGSTELASIAIGGLTDAIAKETAVEGAVYKGVKAQFAIDLSGIVTVTKAEAVVDLPPEEAKEEVKEEEKNDDAKKADGDKTVEEKKEEKEDLKKEEDMVEKETKEEEKKENTKEEEKQEGGEKEEATKKEKEEEKRNEEQQTGNENTTKEEKATKETEKPKPKKRTIKAMLEVTVEEKDVSPLGEEATAAAIERLASFEKAERERTEREAAMNGLEALVYDLAIKIEDGEEFSEFCTEEEKNTIREEASRLRTWLEDDADINTKTEEFLSNKKILDDAAEKANFRKRERLEMPKAVEALDNLFNHSRVFLTAAENMTNTEDPVFTESDLDILRKIITETESWWLEKQEIYTKQAKNEDPAVTTKEMYSKMRDLDREVKYLLNKLKLHIPKPKKADEKKDNGTEKGEEEKKEDNANEKKEEAASEEETAKNDGEKVVAEEDGDQADHPDVKKEESSHDASEF